jgi:ABC-type transport system involved in multi-copper enzyme maturation permease subunit
MPPAVLWISRLLPTNPIVVRLVAGGSKRTRHLYIRSGYLAVMMLVLFFNLLQVGGGGTTMKALAQRGAGAFTVISFGQVGLLCLITPIFMAGAIAQESSPRTWDILLTTPLTNLQIVLGTLFGRLFFVVALLLSTLPLFATTQFFGGVPSPSIFLSYAIAACSALLVASIAVTLSVTRSAGKRAVFVFYVAVVMYLFATYTADLFLRQSLPVAVGTGQFYTTVLTPLNPFLALESLLAANSYTPRDMTISSSWLATWWLGSPVSAFCWSCVLLSIGLIGWATLRLRMIGTRGATIPWWRKVFAKQTSGGERPARSVGTNPIAWRERTNKGSSIAGRLGRWVFVGLGVAAALTLLGLYHTGELTTFQFQGAILAMVGAEVLIVALAAINLSGVAVSREREDGTLDLLLTTPIQPGPYLAGKLRGLVQFLLPMIMVPFLSLGVIAVWVLFNGMGSKAEVMSTFTPSGKTANVTVPVIFAEGAILVPIVLVSFVAFCVMVGLQWSIKSKGTIGSVIAASGVVIVFAGILGLCGFAVGKNVPVVGPVLNALSPFNLVVSVVLPDLTISESLTDLRSARVSLAVGALIAAAVYVVAVISMHATMKRTFMMTVRRLAGTN